MNNISAPQKPAQFTLDGNYKAYIDWAQAVSLEQALERELKILEPMFNGLVEYTDGIDPKYSKDCSDELQDYMNSGAHKTITLSELNRAYSNLVMSQNTLIVCDMPITSRGVLVRRSFQAFTGTGEEEKAFDGKRDSFYPGPFGIKSTDGWCFDQLYRAHSDDRISLPALGLNDNYDLDKVLRGDGKLINQLEHVGRLTNHDWLHQFSPFGIGKATVYTGNPIKAHHKDCHYTMFRLVPKLDSDPNPEGVWHYEGLVMRAHKDILATDSAKTCMDSIESTVDDFIVSLSEQFRKVAQQKHKKTTEYEALQQVAYTMTRFLRRIEPVDGALTQRLLSNVFNMCPRSSMARAAQNKIWKIDPAQSGTALEQAMAGLQKRYDSSILFNDIHKESDFSRSAPHNIAALTAALRTHCL